MADETKAPKTLAEILSRRPVTMKKQGKPAADAPKDAEGKVIPATVEINGIDTDLEGIDYNTVTVDNLLDLFDRSAAKMAEMVIPRFNRYLVSLIEAPEAPSIWLPFWAKHSDFGSGLDADKLANAKAAFQRSVVTLANQKQRTDYLEFAEQVYSILA